MDVWHAMAHVKVSEEHGMRRLSGIALHDKIFIPDKEDKARIETYLKTKNLTWEEQLRLNPRWIWRRCKCVVPPPDKLYDAMQEVYMLYGPQKDSKTKMPLFNAQAWHNAKMFSKQLNLAWCLIRLVSSFTIKWGLIVPISHYTAVSVEQTMQRVVYSIHLEIECQNPEHQSNMQHAVSQIMFSFTILLSELSIAPERCIKDITMLRS
jgi:hypothetical protein